MRIFTPMQRLVSSAHITSERKKIRMVLYRLTDPLCDLTTNVSDEAVEEFVEQKAVDRKRIRCILNGVDTERFKFSELARRNCRKSLKVSESDFCILAVGRLCRQKDYPNLFSALSLLKENGITPKVFIVGAGPLEHELKSVVDERGLSCIVEFLGIRRDIPDLMAACDVFVLPSEWEGFGIVVAEAMACERVVVATDCGGVKEVVGEAGWLVRKKDSADLADKLQATFLLTQADRKMIGHRARLRVEAKFSINQTANNYLEIYGAQQSQQSKDCF